jgi:hypothetical protein
MISAKKGGVMDEKRFGDCPVMLIIAMGWVG